MSSGPAASVSRSISRDFEMSQFWQNLHARLHPAGPKDSTELPGRKRLSGFFEGGSGDVWWARARGAGNNQPPPGRGAGGRPPPRPPPPPPTQPPPLFAPRS